jgi:fused signal recognition particle receptor
MAFFNFFKKKSNNKQPILLKDKLIKSHNKLGFSLNKILFKNNVGDDILVELEELFLKSDLGVKTTNKILTKIKKNPNSKTDNLYELIKNELAKLLITDNKLKIANETFVILVVGVNGAGKTTTIGKLAKLFKDKGNSVMLAAGDTFRAAAIEQLKFWGQENKIDVVSQKLGSDSASVIYDAYQSAKAKKIDILIADTAGRLHTKDNLMNELAKIKRVLKKQDENLPQETMLIIDGGTGQNAINQAFEFNKAINIDSISISKIDGTAKGGSIFGLADELKLPIRYIGIGEGINDIKEFNAKEFIDALF